MTELARRPPRERRDNNKRGHLMSHLSTASFFCIALSTFGNINDIVLTTATPPMPQCPRGHPIQACGPLHNNT